MRFTDLKDRLPTLPEALAPLGALAFNLWWSWDAEATALFGGLDPMGWERVRHNPVALLQDLGADRLSALAEDATFVAQVRSIQSRFEAYLHATNTWAQEHAPSLAPGGQGGVAYLSMEFGLHESLRIYSGGLGVLAGDHVRSASDLGLELVGVGLLYRQGYFRQLIDDGDQVTAFPKADFNRLPVRQAFNDDGTPLRVEVPHGNHSYTAQVFQLDVGRVRLLLLDADHEGNPFDHRFFTQQLYGGDGRTRVAQEVLLGVGGVRAIRAMGLRPAVFHLNEGHCAFAPVELLRERVLQGEPLGAAAEAVKRQVVFTTHTPVPAGHDRFSYYTVEEALGGYREKLGWPQGTIMDMGRVRPTDIHEPLCMTVLALKLSRSTNGVSALHGAVSREMWKDLFPLVLDTAQVPIGHVTNGVHPLFWMGPELRALFDDRLPGWRRRLSDLAYWEESFLRGLRRRPVVCAQRPEGPPGPARLHPLPRRPPRRARPDLGLRPALRPLQTREPAVHRARPFGGPARPRHARAPARLGQSPPPRPARSGPLGRDPPLHPRRPLPRPGDLLGGVRHDPWPRAHPGLRRVAEHPPPPA
ncbi:MAG: alpha-glucan family phosphorylase [Deltaproteobacteria bacterium]|nr:alpha-glucan family phosphorylase [Deltaproteobacteria bacterium]